MLILIIMYSMLRKTSGFICNCEIAIGSTIQEHLRMLWYCLDPSQVQKTRLLSGFPGKAIKPQIRISIKNASGCNVAGGALSAFVLQCLKGAVWLSERCYHSPPR